MRAPLVLWKELALVFLAACGSDPTAPVLSDLSITPKTGVPPGGEVQIAANFSDPDEDLPGGKSELGLRRTTEPRGRTFESPLGGEPTATGRVLLTVTLPAGLVPGPYEVALTVVDSGMRRSNALTATLDVTE